MLEIDNKLSIPLSEFSFSFARSSGPGGQNVNKVNSKAVLKWDVTKTRRVPAEVLARFVEQNQRKISKEGNLVLSSDRFRDQGRNVLDCLEKLTVMLRAALYVQKARKATKPSKNQVKKRLDSKRKHADKKSQRHRVTFY